MIKKDKTYQFTLVLKNVDEFTENLEDSLYESGCSDALINFKNGTVYLDFDREAASLREAVISAIKDVETSPVKPIVASVGPEDFVTETEIAERLSFKRQAVSLWIKRKRRTEFPFPWPVMKLSSRSPFWKWKDVVEWLYDNKLIAENDSVENATFLENINAALEERDVKVFESRKNILDQLNFAHT